MAEDSHRQHLTPLGKMIRVFHRGSWCGLLLKTAKESGLTNGFQKASKKKGRE
jgi:hypothetical protein